MQLDQYDMARSATFSLHKNSCLLLPRMTQLPFSHGSAPCPTTMLAILRYIGMLLLACKSIMTQKPILLILKYMGKKVKHFNEVTWKEEVDNTFLNRLHIKFTQNIDLSSFLKTTGSNILVAANPQDKTFAVGLLLLSKDIWNKSKWNGEYRLRKALIEIWVSLK